MIPSISIYNPTTLATTTIGGVNRSDSSDEGNACGITDSKAQRECFDSDFSVTNTTIRDEETGFGYFGARYYDSEALSGWLSVDSMSDKYPNISPYAYCAWTRPMGGDEHCWLKFQKRLYLSNSVDIQCQQRSL